MTESFSCPHCGSDQIQRYSVAFANGISDVNTNTVGIGVGSGGLGVGGAKTRGTSQSALSMSVAPPKKIGYVGEFLKAFLGIPFVIWIIVAILFPNTKTTSIIFNVIIYGSMAAYLYFHTYKCVYNYNKNIFPQEMENWKKSWICLKCGHRFIQ